MKPYAFVDRHADAEPAADWIDTVPACFHSEALAEDLPLPAAGGPAPASSGPPAPRPRTWATWAAWAASAAWGSTLALRFRRSAATPRPAP
jgi:hypothetical protein